MVLIGHVVRSQRFMYTKFLFIATSVQQKQTVMSQKRSAAGLVVPSFVYAPVRCPALVFVFRGAEAGWGFIAPRRGACTTSIQQLPLYSEDFRKSGPALGLARWFKTNQPL